MKFTEEHAAKALRDLGIDFAQENFPLSALVDGMNAELRHGRKARGTNLTDDDPTMTAMLAVNNLRVSPSYYSGRVGKSAWERSLSRGVKHRGGKTEVKTIDFELEDINTESGVFSGYGAVFSNIDSGGDIIEPGAFTKTIAEGWERVKILALHNDCWLPIGRPLELREDSNGLFIKAKISDTSMGRDVKVLLKDGVLTELSIGYDPVVFDYDETGIRHLREVKLWETSLVTWAMNPQAVVTDYKETDEPVERAKAMAEEAASDLKAGRKISSARLKALKEASASMKAATKALDSIIKEATEGEGKNDPGPVTRPSGGAGRAGKNHPGKNTPLAGKTTIEIML